ncbi:MAG: AraC family transcriptional regulator [Bryobacteraceae bacterium]|nr:AraC family transcriptional regulator [Bryobacteraceae bacterium]
MATRFPISLYSTANPVHQEVFYTVPRAGHMIGDVDHHIRREHFPGHELIYCLRGAGWVRLEGTAHRVGPGELAWVNCHHPHEHGAVREEPWEVLWVRVEGPRLEQMCTMLSAATNPVFAIPECAGIYEEIFTLIQTGAPESAPLLHAAVAKLLARICCARTDLDPAMPAPVRRAVERMRLFYFEPHTVEGLASLAGMSPSHFSRVFRATFGTSPIDWLRRERISQAKRRLGDTADPIQWIAQAVGYRDRFFFSKDFKKLTGFTPTEFRARERL